ncbi:DUF805 domain-containing protein [uncultured Bartonella sp.]|uniref:DUF805 domain-containing protein n=1 Tax=uncultured Bartonella sp. TaxID=104108 RepID=UPI003449884C
MYYTDGTTGYWVCYLFHGRNHTNYQFCFMAIFTIGQIIPHPALVTRRLHDLNISGWWAVLIVPVFFGSFIGVFLWLFMALFSWFLWFSS